MIDLVSKADAPTTLTDVPAYHNAALYSPGFSEYAGPILLVII